MNIEDICRICSKLPAVTEDIKWGHDLCFCVAKKMFLVVGLDESPTHVAFKAADEEFEEMSSREGFKPAPYLARHKWVAVDDLERLNHKEWEDYINRAYQLIKSKLPKNIRKGIENL